jgi:hypothetical protein
MGYLPSRLLKGVNMSTKFTKTLFSAALVAGTMLTATPAFAQATRTWVSGVGDDANPCSRTAPCKTFAGAISKTAAGGEINCLDPGGFGAVTINKTLTIDCHFTEGGVLAGGNGIVVNAAATDVVVIRGLDIFGVTPPTHGVRILVAGAVIIEDCVIRRFNAASSFGVSFQPSGATKLYISNTAITQNGSGATGGGINVQPTGVGTAMVWLNNVHVVHNANDGMHIDTSANLASTQKVDIQNSDFAGNVNGVNAIGASGVNLNVAFIDSRAVNNTGTGLIATNGVIYLTGHSTIFGNNTGVSASGVATMGSYGDNYVNGNGTDGTFSPFGPK